MFNKILTFLFIFIFSACVFPQQPENKSNAQIINVIFCDLMKNPTVYSDKLTSIKATYRYGFEWSELYCSDCLDRGRIWLDVTDSFSEDSKKKYRKKLKSNGFAGKTVNVTFVGKVYSGGRYGHMGAYEYKFIAQRVEFAEVILKDSPVYPVLPDEIKAKTYCQKKDQKAHPRSLELC